MTLLCKRWVKNIRIDVGLDAGYGERSMYFSGIHFISSLPSAQIGKHDREESFTFSVCFRLVKSVEIKNSSGDVTLPEFDWFKSI